MDKYYEPNLEEFYQGFLYESQQMDGDGYYTNEYCEFEYEIGEKIDLNKVRVKYLDKEDIESLGWKFIGGDNILMGFIKNNINIDFFINSKTLRIYENKTELICKGNIKNKSELIKLLKQLGIG